MELNFRLCFQECWAGSLTPINILGTGKEKKNFRQLSRMKLWRKFMSRLISYIKLGAWRNEISDIWNEKMRGRMGQRYGSHLFCWVGLWSTGPPILWAHTLGLFANKNETFAFCPLSSFWANQVNKKQNWSL